MPNPRHGEQDSVQPSGQPLSGRPGWLVPVSGPGLFLIGLILLAGLFTLFYQLQGELDLLESQLMTEAGGERMKSMGEQMVLLQNRLHGLMADSVEIRLKALERTLANGYVTPEVIQQFEVLQNDIRSLETYAQGPNAPNLDQAIPDHPRYSAMPGVTSPALSKADMFREISRLRTLLYLCLTGLVATGGVLLGRYWLASQRPPQLPHTRSSRPPLLTRRR